MTAPIHCIYCKATQGEPSAEHVIAHALGGCIKLPATDVCRTSNSTFGHDFETKVYRDLLPILVQLQIPGKDGDLPSWKFAELDGDNRRNFVLDAEGIKSAEPRK